MSACLGIMGTTGSHGVPGKSQTEEAVMSSRNSIVIVVALAVVGAVHGGSPTVNHCPPTARATTRTTVARLTARVARLEKGPQSVPASKAAWRKIDLGMNEGQVRGILGEPKEVDVSPLWITWGYGYPAKVTFDVKTGLVDGWGRTGAFG